MIEPGYTYRATLDRVIDGDTYVLNVDLGFRVYSKVMVRLRGVDCPELSVEGGPAARSFAATTLLTTSVLVRSHLDRQSFARWVCDVWVNGAPLADVLVAAGHGTAS